MQDVTMIFISFIIHILDEVQIKMFIGKIIFWLYLYVILNGSGRSSGKTLDYELHTGCSKGGAISLLLRAQTGHGVHSSSYKMNTGSKRGRA